MSDPPDDAPPEGTREYSRDEYMRIFKVSESTMERHVERGTIIKRRIGRRVLLHFPPDAPPEEPREDPLTVIVKVVQKLTETVQAQNEAIARLEREIAALRGAGEAQRALPYTAGNADAAMDKRLSRQADTYDPQEAPGSSPGRGQSAEPSSEESPESPREAPGWWAEWRARLFGGRK